MDWLSSTIGEMETELNIWLAGLGPEVLSVVKKCYESGKKKRTEPISFVEYAVKNIGPYRLLGTWQDLQCLEDIRDRTLSLDDPTLRPLQKEIEAWLAKQDKCFLEAEMKRFKTRDGLHDKHGFVSSVVDSRGDRHIRKAWKQLSAMATFD